MRRGGMPEPGSFFFACAGARACAGAGACEGADAGEGADACAGAVADAGADPHAGAGSGTGTDTFTGGVLVVATSSAGTTPTRPVFHGIGSTLSEREGCASTQTSFTRRFSQRMVPSPRFSPISR